RDPDLDAALSRGLGVAPHAKVGEGRTVEPGDRERLVPCGLVARVDVDERECGPPRFGQLAGPRMDLEAGLVAQPAQRRRMISDEVVVGLAILTRIKPRLVPAAQ